MIRTIIIHNINLLYHFHDYNISSPRHATQVIRVALECNEKLIHCIRLLD